MFASSGFGRLIIAQGVRSDDHSIELAIRNKRSSPWCGINPIHSDWTFRGIIHSSNPTTVQCGGLFIQCLLRPSTTISCSKATTTHYVIKGKLFSLKQFGNPVLVVMAVEGLTTCGGGEPPLSTPPQLPPEHSHPRRPLLQHSRTGSQSLTGSRYTFKTSLKNVKSYHGTFTTQMAGNTVDSVFDFQAPDKMHMNYKYTQQPDIIIWQ